MREMFEAGSTRAYSLAALARLADRIGLRGTKGARLGKQQIANMLRCTAYYCEFTWSGETWWGKYEPLISRDLFERARRAMLDGAKPKTRTHVFAYAGLVRCVRCNGAQGLLRRARESFELVQVVADQFLQRDAGEKERVVRTCISNLIVTDGTSQSK